jgi:hypothetical protein
MLRRIEGDVAILRRMAAMFAVIVVERIEAARQ